MILQNVYRRLCIVSVSWTNQIIVYFDMHDSHQAKHNWSMGTMEWKNVTYNMDLINFQSTTIWKFVVWTGIHCVGPLLHLRNHCIARSFKAIVVEWRRYCAVSNDGILELVSKWFRWNVKSASFLPHDPFIGKDLWGVKGAPPTPSHEWPSHSLISCNFWETGVASKVVCCMLNQPQALKW